MAEGRLWWAAAGVADVSAGRQLLPPQQRASDASGMLRALHVVAQLGSCPAWGSSCRWLSPWTLPADALHPAPCNITRPALARQRLPTLVLSFQSAQHRLGWNWLSPSYEGKLGASKASESTGQTTFALAHSQEGQQVNVHGVGCPRCKMHGLL